MFSQRSILTVVVAAWALAAGVARLAAQEPQLGIAHGSRPEAVTLRQVDGEEVDLGDHFGQRPVLLEFWATWCENCKALHPRMLEAHRRYGDRVQFFAVAVAVGQTEKRVRSHLEKRPVPYPTQWDGLGEAVRAFRTPATSYIVILDAGGRVAYTGIGRDQDVEAAVRGVLAESQATD
jgi:thiol-disulfide isomerase/thioredoxin